MQCKGWIAVKYVFLLLGGQRKIDLSSSVYVTNTDVFSMDFIKNMKNVLYLSLHHGQY